MGKKNKIRTLINKRIKLLEDANKEAMEIIDNYHLSADYDKHKHKQCMLAISVYQERLIRIQELRYLLFLLEVEE